jgi:DNA-binding NarL/FixJ family response regulator
MTMPEALSRDLVRPEADAAPELRVDPVDLSNASSALAETCSALALSLHEGDLDAAERLFAFVLGQTADRRVAVTTVLAPMLLGTGGCALLSQSGPVSVTAHEFVRRLRRPVSTVGSQGVLLRVPDNGPMFLMSELTALLLDDAHVPVFVRHGMDAAAVGQTANTECVAAVAFGATSCAQARGAEPTIRRLRRAGVSVLVIADPEVVPPDFVRSIGASAAAWQPGEIADALLRLRGPLSVGEAEVLRLAADGYTNVRISHELGISLSAVKARLESSYAKLRAADRTHAVALALRQRWIL